MGTQIVGQAVAMFAVTNIDDLIVLALFFGQAAGYRGGAVRVTLGQYLGFSAILVASVVGALGAALLPGTFVPYLGLLPLLLGLRAAWEVWRERGDESQESEGLPKSNSGGGVLLTVAGVTFANGADNIGVYVPVFANANATEVLAYCGVFLVMVGIWCALGHFLATRPVIAKALARWGHLLYPAVLIGLGVFILVEGGAFGL